MARSWVMTMLENIEPRFSIIPGTVHTTRFPAGSQIRLTRITRNFHRFTKIFTVSDKPPVDRSALYVHPDDYWYFASGPSYSTVTVEPVDTAIETKEG